MKSHPQKHQDLHGCTLRVSGKIDIYDHLAYEIIWSLSKYLNYKTNNVSKVNPDTQITNDLLSNSERFDNGPKPKKRCSRYNAAHFCHPPWRPLHTTRENVYDIRRWRMDRDNCHTIDRLRCYSSDKCSHLKFKTSSTVPTTERRHWIYKALFWLEIHTKCRDEILQGFCWCFSSCGA